MMVHQTSQRSFADALRQGPLILRKRLLGLLAMVCNFYSATESFALQDAQSFPNPKPLRLRNQAAV